MRAVGLLKSLPGSPRAEGYDRIRAALPVLTAGLEICSIQFAAIKITEANAQKSHFKAGPWEEIGIACVFSSYNFKMMETVPAVGKRNMGANTANNGRKRPGLDWEGLLGPEKHSLGA